MRISNHLCFTRRKAVLFLILSMLIAVLLIYPLTETLSQDSVDGSNCWMSQLEDTRPLNQITIPGSHDSASQHSVLGFFTKCQFLSLLSQLNSGIRYLDLRVSDQGNGGTLYLSHDFAPCRTGPVLWFNKMFLDDALQQCYQFLDENPSETVLIAVKHEFGHSSDEEFEQNLFSYIDRDPDYWLLIDHIPSLGEARGKLVLLRRFPDSAGFGSRSGIDIYWEDQGMRTGTILGFEENVRESCSLMIQDHYHYTVDEKWTSFLMSNESGILEDHPDHILINFLSTIGPFVTGHPHFFANRLNDRLTSYTESDIPLCGWILMDFATPDLCRLVYQSNY